MSAGRREGSVYERKSDHRWVAVLLFEDRPPKLIYGATKAEAIRRRAEEIRDGTDRRLDGWSKRPVKEYLAHWLTHIKQDQVRASTFRNYRIHIGHVIPLIGDVKLAALTPGHIDYALSKLAKAGKSAKLRRHVHARLKHALTDAVSRDYITRNPMEKIKPPKVEPRQMHTLTDEQVACVLGATEGTWFHALWHVLLRTGIRVSEARALTWRDIDDVAGLLHVTKAASDPVGGVVVGPPKSRDSIRDVPLFPDTLAVLRDHRRLTLRTPAWAHPELVFPSRRGNYLRLSVIGREWARVLDDLSIPHVHVHDLRVTFGTVALETTGDLRTAQQLMGHSAGSTTMLKHYWAVREGRKREVLRQVARAMGAEEGLA